MRRITLLWVLVSLGLPFYQVEAIAETMYVTDRLHLAFRSVPEPDQPATTLIPSDTKVEVLDVRGDWAQVKLEDGRTGWVLKRFLVTDPPQSITIQELKAEIDTKDRLLEKLQEEISSLKEDASDRRELNFKEEALRSKIETLKSQLEEQKKRLDVSSREKTLERLKEVYITGIVALFVGLLIGYLLRRPQKKRHIFYSSY